MQIKKILSLGIVLSLTTSMLIGCSSNNSKDEKSTQDLKITMVSDIGGINDQSFNQSAWEGIKISEKELGLNVEVIDKIVKDYRFFDDKERECYNNVQYSQ